MGKKAEQRVWKAASNMRRIRHLYLKIYLAFIVILLGTIVAAVVVRVSFERDFDKYPQFARGVAEILVERLPTVRGPQLDAALNRASERLGVELVIWGSDAVVVAHSEHAPAEARERDPRARHSAPHGVITTLSDGRYVGAFFRHPPAHGKFLLWLTFFACILALGCYPLARGITRRLEQLRAVADSWGQGALNARAPVEGHDEIAQLSRTFNQAAERVQSLVAQQKRILASASHELRSPLARLQMGLALLEEATPARRNELATELEREVAELNQLIEDFLIAAKAEHPVAHTQVALDQIVTHECQRLNITRVRVVPLSVHGNEAALRSMLRNLLENAVRHGGGAEVSVALEAAVNECFIRVEDSGPGVDAALTERIFEPFYRPSDHDEGKHGGVGLGLALVRQIAEAHQGTAKYEPRQGGGSRFVVVLPLVPDLRVPSAHA